MPCFLAQPKCRQHGCLMFRPDRSSIFNDDVHHQVWPRSGDGPRQDREDKEVYRAFATQSCPPSPRPHGGDVLARGAADDQSQRFPRQLLTQSLEAPSILPKEVPHISRKPVVRPPAPEP